MIFASSLPVYYPLPALIDNFRNSNLIFLAALEFPYAFLTVSLKRRAFAIVGIVQTFQKYESIALF